MFAIVRSLPALLVARVIQGLAAAIVSVVGIAFLTESVDETRTAAAMGYLSVSMTWGMILGPVLGGVT